MSKATQLGLNTCWILKDFNRDKCKCTINKGQRLICIIAISCEEIKVNPYDRKTQNVIYREQDDVPDWFKKGFKHASSIDNIEGNQHFLFSLSDGKVRIEPMDRIYSKIELGVTKFRFENAAGKNNFVWDNVIKRSFQYPFGVIQYTRN